MVCDVPNCPVIVAPGSRFCELHKRARTAKELGFGPDANGLNAARCARCRRAFRDPDFVERVAVSRTVRGKPIPAFRHVACEPPTAKLTRKQLRESAKPLIDATADGID